MNIKYRLTDAVSQRILGIFQNPEEAQSYVNYYCGDNERTIFDFKLELINLPEWHKIRTFNDALHALEAISPHHQYISDYYRLIAEGTDNISRNLLAYVKLKIITAVINVDYQSETLDNKIRYYPVIHVYQDKEFQNSDLDEACIVLPKEPNPGAVMVIKTQACITDHPHTDALCFGNGQLALHAIANFKDLYADYFCYGRK